MSSSSRSRTSCRSASRPVSRFDSTACSIPSGPTSRWPKPSARASTRSASSTKPRPDSRRPISPGRHEGMTAPAVEPTRRGGALTPAFAAVRARWLLVALLFALAIAGWWWTADQMSGMDNGPWTDLGAFSWFITVWIVMMAAMMFPSVAPTVALYARMTRQRSPMSPLLFTTGYLVAWTGGGLLVFALRNGIDAVDQGVLTWDRAGRWIAGATLIV